MAPLLIRNKKKILRLYTSILFNIVTHKTLDKCIKKALVVRNFYKPPFLQHSITI